MALLYSPLKIRDVIIKNRIGMSPMDQYKAINGMAGHWHYVHYGSRAVGGVGLIMIEATAVTENGRISPGDMGLWNEDQILPLKSICDFLKDQGAVPGIQLAHAGRKASTYITWEGDGTIPLEKGGWRTVAPSPIPFDKGYPVPQELSKEEILIIEDAFVKSAKRAVRAGFEIIEIHAAHGYLINQFLSPITNQRADEYGGGIENRMRILIEIIDKVRAEIPQGMPLFVRISATDYQEGGWNINDSVLLAVELKRHGVDLIDVSTGGLVPAPVKSDYGYQLRYAHRIKKAAEMLTSAVGMITTPEQAESALFNEFADLIFFGRELLRNPYFALNSAPMLRSDIKWPDEYLRAKIR